jgi:SUMO ligase MMS21 Smc5/6 complex component
MNSRKKTNMKTLQLKIIDQYNIVINCYKKETDIRINNMIT